MPKLTVVKYDREAACLRWEQLEKRWFKTEKMKAEQDSIMGGIVSHDLEYLEKIRK